MNTILYNAAIYQNERADAILIENGKIKHIGQYKECRLSAKQSPTEYNLEGKMILPAFTDSHTHFVEYAKSKILVNLHSCISISDIIVYLNHYRQNLTWQPQWILGGGWNRNILSEPHFISKELLDSIFPDIPVALFSRDYHAKWCNSLALKIAGIDCDTPNPAGGFIEKDDLGKPTGILFEAATLLLEPFILSPPSSAIIQAIKETVNSMYEWGLVGFHSMEYYASAQLLRQAQNEGSRFRCCWHFQADELEIAKAKYPHSYAGDDWFKIGGIKLFGDGSLGSKTAAMFTPYSDDPENLGILRYTDDELYHTILQAAQQDFSSTIHAIGDRCVNQVINSILKLNSNPSFKHLLHRLEHVQSIHPKDIPLLKQSGMLISLQPVHIANDIPMIQKSWHHIQNQAYAFKSLIENNIPYSFGSDTPIETMNPFLGIYSALERKASLNDANPSWQANEKISIDKAIHGYTMGAAMSSRSNNNQGSLEIGKAADILVVEDYRNLPNNYWLEAKSYLTMVGGEVVFLARW